MKKNMHLIDRIVRLILAVIIGILILNSTITGFAGILLGIIAVIFLVTGIISFCPLYKALGISTVKKEVKTV
ncbi:MAG TPA: DUF2892 domain-containing protein [Ignavibacteriaceae bacterium]|nr:DUF2892 domain-containing protein [Ignavibacteriaceae bacterium]